jgi:hypothetical protein
MASLERDDNYVRLTVFGEKAEVTHFKTVRRHSASRTEKIHKNLIQDN